MITKVLSLFGRNKDPKKLFFELHKCLDLFIHQEARLWGVELKELKNNQEEALEEINHLIYKFQNTPPEKMKLYLKSKNFNDIEKELKIIHEELKHLKKLINRQEVFKNTLTSLTLLLVNEDTYELFEDIFLLEKQLQEVLIWQEEEFKQIFTTSKDLKIQEIDSNTKSELFYNQLVEVRRILAGNLDHHDLWEDEMQGFSNCSNILHALKAKILQLEKFHYNQINKI
ncbi:MAG: hypothetical protein LAT82_03780 [Nanoarchaeota archaeon]|nr:hypothetical protein [Nanoarchaeota archaeon]